MSDWKNAFRSFYYETAEPPENPELKPSETALLVIDIQNTYLEVPADPEEAARWTPFLERMNYQVIPGTAALVDQCRSHGFEIIYARIACLTEDGRDRSLSQKKTRFQLSFAAEGS